MIDCYNVLTRSSAYELVRRDMEQGLLSHSYMVVADDERVVDEFIRLVTLLVFCESHTACRQCAKCHRVLNGNNANIYAVVPENGKDIKVGEVTAMIEDTYITPYEDDYKVYTIARGEALTVQAQNKLLKTLEEPVGRKLILIGTTNESNMLDTIKSRCKKIHISPFTYDEIVEIFGAESDADTLERAFKLSGGRVSLIEKMLGEELGLEYDKVVDMLLELKSSRDLPRVVGMIGKKITRDSVSDFLSMLEVVLRDTLRGDNVGLALGGFNARTIANIEDLVIVAREKLNFNCGAYAVLDYVLFGILEVKYKCRL